MDAFRVKVGEVLEEIAVSIPAFWAAYMLGLPPFGAFIVGVLAMSVLRGYNRGDFGFGGREVDRSIPYISLGNALFYLNCVALAQWAWYLENRDWVHAVQGIVAFAFLEAVILAGKHFWGLVKARKAK